MNNKKEINNQLLLKSSFWYTVSNFLTRAMVFITTPIFTRLMSKKAYGDFSIFANWQAIFLIICGLEIYATLNRARFDYEEEKDLNAYITSCLVMSTALTTVVFAIYLAFPVFFYNLFKLERRYILIMFAYLYTYPAFAMFQAKQRVEYRYKLSALLTFLLVFTAALASVLLVTSAMEDKLAGRILGQYVPYVVAGLFFYLFFLKKSRTIRKDMLEYAIRLGLPLVLGFLGSQILVASEKVIVQHLCPDDDVAYMVLATTCAHIMLIFVQSLNNAWAPWFFDKLDQGEYPAIKKTFRIYMIFIIFCTFAVLMVGPEVVRILGGKSYAPSVQILSANMVCGIFTALTAQFINIETFYKKTRYSAILTLIVSVINIGLGIVGVKLYGYQAAVYVTVFSQMLLVVLHYIVVRRIAKDCAISLKELILELAVTVVLIAAALLLYKVTIVRWALIGVIAVAVLIAAWIKRDMIIGFIKRKR